MNIIELLKAFAQELESPENIALRNTESESEEVLDAVAQTCLTAAAVFNKAAQEIALMKSASEGAAGGESIEHEQMGAGSPFSVENLEEMAAVAAEFDASGDPLLQKQASVLDAILMTVSAPKGMRRLANDAEDKKLDALRKEYAVTKEKLDGMAKTSDQVKDIQKSEYYKQYRPLEQALSSRYCPDHPGVMVHRVGEHEYQCEMDKKTYNWDTGFKTQKGNTVPGGSVDEQTVPPPEPHSVFDTRSERLRGE